MRSSLRVIALVAFTLALAPIANAHAEPPVIAIESPVNGSVSANQTPAFAGATDDPSDEVDVAIYVGPTAEGTSLQTLVSVPLLETWLAGPAEALPDGTYTAQATQTNLALEPGVSPPVTFTVDTTPPDVSLTPPATVTNDPEMSFGGAAGALAGDSSTVKLQLYTGGVASGTPLDTVEVTRNGSTWSTGSLPSLADGLYTVRAEQSDEAGNVGFSAPSTFTVDTVAPVPSLTPVVTPSNDATPTIAGAAGVATGDLPEVRLKIYAGVTATGSPLRTIDATVLAGGWSVGPVASLPDGVYTARGEQADDAGNTGFTASSTFTVDTVAPLVSLGAPASLTTDTRPTFEGKAGVAAGDEAMVKVKVYAGATVSGSPVEMIETTRSGGSWSATTASPLADGLYTARVEQSDQAGNVGFSAPSTFTVDTVAPAPSLTPVATPSNDATPTIAGSAGVASGDLPEVRLKIYAGSTATGTPLRTIDATVLAGGWSVGPVASLPNGIYTVRAEQSDEAGNTGFTASSTFTVDTVAPLVSLVAPASLTTDTTPTFEGKAGVAAGDDAVVKVKVYAGATVSGSPVEMIETTRSGGSWSATTASSLADGVYTVEAQQSDQAGNTGVSASFKFRLDTTAPAVALSAPVNGAMTDSSSEPVQGTAGTSEGDLPTVTVELFEGSTIGVQEPLETIVVKAVAGHWATTFGGLGEGDYTVRAEQSDSLGNLGKTLPATFTVDEVAPVVSIAPVEVKITDNTPSFSGNAGSAAGDLPTVKLNLYKGAIVSASPLLTVDATSSAGVWSVGPLSALANGEYTIQAEQSDAAGNTGKSVPATFTLEAPEPPPSKETTPPPTTTTPTPEPQPQHSPPVASFTWFPPLPHTGEAVSVVSNSTDLYSPITTLAWALAGNPFKAGSDVFTTSFATPGQHVVRLRVTAADGLSGTVMTTIPVTSPPAILMQPFPVVRIAGNNTVAGARLKLITVQAPAGARITVTCKGRGCPGKESRVTSSRKRGVVLVEFKRFERLLGAGAVLEIRVSKAGQIGKYTRFQIRKGALPERSDSCLSPTGTKPMTCPS